MDHQHSSWHCGQCPKRTDFNQALQAGLGGEISRMFARKQKLEQTLHAAMASGSLLFCALGLLALEHL